MKDDIDKYCQEHEETRMGQCDVEKERSDTPLQEAIN